MHCLHCLVLSTDNVMLAVHVRMSSSRQLCTCVCVCVCVYAMCVLVCLCVYGVCPCAWVFMCVVFVASQVHNKSERGTSSIRPKGH